MASAHSCGATSVIRSVIGYPSTVGITIDVDSFSELRRKASRLAASAASRGSSPSAGSSSLRTSRSSSFIVSTGRRCDDCLSGCRRPGHGSGSSSSPASFEHDADAVDRMSSSSRLRASWARPKRHVGGIDPNMRRWRENAEPPRGPGPWSSQGAFRGRTGHVIGPLTPVPPAGCRMRHRPGTSPVERPTPIADAPTRLRLSPHHARRCRPPSRARPTPVPIGSSGRMRDGEPGTPSTARQRLGWLRRTPVVQRPSFVL